MNNYNLKTLVKSDSVEGMDYPSKPDFRPSFSLSEKDLPEIKDWKIGQKYMLEMEVEMVSASKNEYGRSLHQSRFKIIKIGTEEEDEATMMGKKGHR